MLMKFLTLFCTNGRVLYWGRNLFKFYALATLKKPSTKLFIVIYAYFLTVFHFKAVANCFHYIIALVKII